MQESGWLQQALENAISEANGMGDRIGLARLAILERLVSPANANPRDEDTLLDALDTLRALEWARLSSVEDTLRA